MTSRTMKTEFERYLGVVRPQFPETMAEVLCELTKNAFYSGAMSMANVVGVTLLPLAEEARIFIAQEEKGKDIRLNLELPRK